MDSEIKNIINFDHLPIKLSLMIVCQLRNDLLSLKNLQLTNSRFRNLVLLHFQHIKIITFNKIDSRNFSIKCEQLLFEYYLSFIDKDLDEIKKKSFFNFLKMVNQLMPNVNQVRLYASDWDLECWKKIDHTFSPRITKMDIRYKDYGYDFQQLIDK